MATYSAISAGSLSLAFVSTGTRFCVSNRNPKHLLKQSWDFKICFCSTSPAHSKLPPPNEAEKKKKNRRREAKRYDDGDYENGDFVVVNFYKFVFIKDPEEEVAKHLAFVEVRD